jgi:cell shape-determining protein MreC
MMTARSYDKSRRIRQALKVLGLCCVLTIGYFGAAEIRDGTTFVLSTTDEARRYALMPRALLLERLQSRESELARIQYQAVVYAAQGKALAELRKESSLRPTEAYGTARVVGTPPKTHYDTILIAAGTNDGVVLGDIVTVEGVAIGEITDVSAGSALAQLYSSPGATHDAFIGVENAIVVTHGLGGGALEASVSDDIAIAVGDTLEDPKTGFVMGVVSSVVRREIDTSALLRIVIPFTPSSLRLVSLVHAP